MEENRGRAYSRETLVSMQELDPSPVQDTPVEEAAKPEYFPDSKSSAHQSTASSLGLSGHSTTWWLNRVQRYSSYTFTAYLAAHFTNTAILPLVTRSISASDNYLLLTRPYYQSPLLEPLIVFAPLVAHIGSGILLRIHRRRQSLQWYGAESRSDRRNVAWPKLSATSALGYALVPLVAGHVLVNRLVPLWVDGDSSGIGLAFVAHGFARHPVVAFVWYGAMVGIATGHFVWGWAKWLGLTPDVGSGGDAVDQGLRKKRRWYGINGLSIAVAGLWMTAGLGVVGRSGPSEGWIGRGFDKLFDAVPIVGGFLH